MHAKRILVIPSILMCLAGQSLAFADTDPGAILFDQGLQAMNEGRYEDACPPLEQSYRIDPRPGTLFALAECEAHRGRVATALTRYDEYLAMYTPLSRDKKVLQGNRQQVARRQKALLEPQIPQLTLVLPPDTPKDAVVQCDGAPVPKASLGKPLAIDPGEHVITLVVPGETLSELRANLSAGQKLLLNLALRKQSFALAKPATVLLPGQLPASNPVLEEPSPSAGRRVAAFTTGGVGLVGLVVGGIMGGFAIAQKATVDANCTPTADKSTLRCSHEGFQASQSMKNLGLWATISVGIGAAASGVTVVLLATEPQKGKRTAGTHGATASAGILGAGSDGMIAGVRGAW